MKAENAERAAQVTLSLQKAEHVGALSALQRELVALRSKPDLEVVVSELEEKNREMEEMLRAKCEEVEASDDQAIESVISNSHWHLSLTSALGC